MAVFVKIATDEAPQRYTQRIVRVVVWGCAILFLLALALRDLQLDRRLDVVVRLDRATPYLSLLGPPSRVALSFDRAALRAEPVYVNLRIPRWFRRVTVELEYENPGDLPFKLGVRTHPTEWAFEFPEPESLPLSLPAPTPSRSPSGRGRTVPEGRGETVQTLRVPFDLQRAWQVERNVYRFVLSAPGVSAEQSIVIRGLRVVAEREAVCVGRFCI